MVHSHVVLVQAQRSQGPRAAARVPATTASRYAQGRTQGGSPLVARPAPTSENAPPERLCRRAADGTRDASGGGGRPPRAKHANRAVRYLPGTADTASGTGSTRTCGGVRCEEARQRRVYAPHTPPPPLPTRDATAWPPANGGWSSRPSTWWCAANGGLCSWEPPPTCRRTRREAPAAAWLGNPWVRVACGCYAPPPPNRRASREITRLWLPSTWYPPDTSPGARAVSTADGGSDRPLSSAALGGAGVSLFGEIPLHTVWVDRHTWSVEQPAPTCIASPEVSGTCMPILDGAANHHLWSAIPEDCTTRTRWSTTHGSEGERGGGGRHKEPGPRLVPPTRRDGLGARSPAGARTKA